MPAAVTVRYRRCQSRPACRRVVGTWESVVTSAPNADAVGIWVSRGPLSEPSWFCARLTGSSYAWVRRTGELSEGSTVMTTHAIREATTAAPKTSAKATATTRTTRTVRRRATRYRPERAPLLAVARGSARRCAGSAARRADPAAARGRSEAAPGDDRAAGGGTAAAHGGKPVEDRAGVALARVPRNSAGLAAGDNRGHSLGEEKASKALPSAVAWAGSVAAGATACRGGRPAPARGRRRGDCRGPRGGPRRRKPVPGPRAREAPARARPRRTRGRDPPQREPDTVAAVGGAFENPPGGEVADQPVCGRQGQPVAAVISVRRVAGHRRGTSAGSA